MLKKITCQFTLSTPAFIGSGSGQCADTLSPASIKGALRFWWRALQWDSLLQLSDGNATKALARLSQQERDLFGSASGSTGNQSRVLIKPILPLKGKLSDKNSLKGKPGLQYLAGMGLYHFKKGMLREALQPFSFDLSLVLKNLGSEQETQLGRALLALGSLGGVGSRSRKGFGSLCLHSVEGLDIAAPSSPAEWRQALQQLGRWNGVALPPYTAFSALSRIDSAAGTSSSALDTLESIGRELQLYRSYGREGKVAERDAERNFRDDHDSILEFSKSGNIETAPRRSVFGLPHNYFFSSTKSNIEIGPEKLERRTSPLFIHVHQFSSGENCALLSLLPARFLPDGQGLKLKPKGQSEKVLPSSRINPDWQVIHDFMNRLDNRERLL